VIPEQDRSRIASLEPLILLEVGSGSGCVITFLTQLLYEELGKNSVVSFATDINPQASLSTSRTAGHNKVFQKLLYAMKESTLETNKQTNKQTLID
jgi:release factor glutamine methyltransferase